MAEAYETRTFEYTVDRCPQCGKSHQFPLEVRYIPAPGGVILFAGQVATSATPPAAPAPAPWDVTFTCPKTQQTFVQPVAIDAQGHKIVGVMLGSAIALKDELIELEYTEWVKASAGTAREFCKTMMTTCTGAIPVFFAVLKFLGQEKASTPFLSWLGIIPTAAFLAALALFILALRPQYVAVAGVSSFARERERRLGGMNRLIQIGTLLFLAGIGLSIVAFAWAVGQ